MKYKFTGKTKEHLNRTLHQIEAIRNFGNVEKGTVGGWIEKESNLSHEGECWVYNDAKVFGNAQVFGDTLVFGNTLGKKNQNLPEELNELSSAFEEVIFNGKKYKRVTKWEEVSE